MYREKDLIGKEVISLDGEVVGEVIGVTMRDDSPYMIVGKTGFLVSKSRILESGSTIVIPCFEIDTVHDKVMITKTKEEILKDLKGGL